MSKFVLNHQQRVIEKILVLFFLSILIVVFYIYPLGADPFLIWCCLLIFYSYLAQSLRAPIEVRSGLQTFFKIDLLFMTFYYLLFFLPYQTYVLGINDIKENFFLIDTFWEYTNKSLIACTIGLIAFMEGFKRKSLIRRKITFKVLSILEYRKLFNVLLVFALILFVIFIFTGLKSYLTDVYSGSDTGDKTTNGIYFLISMLMLFLASFSLIFFWKYREKRILFYIVCVLYCFLLLLSGDRNSFFLIAVALTAGYFSYIKQIGRLRLIAMMASALYLYQVVEISRNSEKRGVDSLISSLMLIEEKEKSKYDIDKSSFSITTSATRIAFYMVPNRMDFFYGKFKVIGFAGVVPFSRGLIVDPSDKFITSTDVLIQGAGTNWSVGSSIIADLYLDFGLVGILIVMFFLGWLARYFQSKAIYYQQTMKWPLMYLIVISLFSQLPRYSLDFIVRDIFWALLIFWIFEKTRKVNNSKFSL